MPHYRKRGGMMGLTYTKSGTSIKDGVIKLSRGIKIQIPQWEKYCEVLQSWQQVRVIPNNRDVKVEIIYEQEIKQAEVSKDKCAAIDLGLNNLAEIFFR